MSEKSRPAWTDQLSPLSTMTSKRMLFNLPDVDGYEFDLDANDLMSLQSPISLTSSLLALSPISDLDLLPNFDLSTSPSIGPKTAIPASRAGSPSPSPSLNLGDAFAIKLGPCPARCESCGSAVFTPPPSTVALYSLALTMATSTRSKKAPPSTQTADADTANPPPTTAKRVTGRKRKSPSDEDSAPVDAPAPTESAPRANPKSKTKRGKTPAAPVAADATPIGAPPTNNSAAGSSQDAPRQSTEAGTDLVPVAGASTTSQDTHNAARVEELEKELRALKKFKVMWAKQQRDQTSLTSEGGPSTLDGSIPRPPGERGKNGWNMQTALQLEADGDTYNLILAATRDAVRETGLDWKKKFDEQEPARVGTCYSQMKHVHPYLKRFKGDWACRELVISALQNRRKVEHARIKALMVRSPSKPPKSKRAGFKPRSKPSAASPTPDPGVNNADVQQGEEEETE
ncbi:hypothetical protein M407DRAFT_213183 [Tulasnella calospora MUT 4182]|uniref:Uncharacterized protein n=1 Tax=Tulasnella calospora MUT 4182 TaxID=1051891 RepID=A0A0C3QEF6_9AGAM|nr:hypothetical protein M407DRAFT_213183 [Tulasnella calospora MUT 4182]